MILPDSHFGGSINIPGIWHLRQFDLHSLFCELVCLFLSFEISWHLLGFLYRFYVRPISVYKRISCIEMLSDHLLPHFIREIRLALKLLCFMGNIHGVKLLVFAQNCGQLPHLFRCWAKSFTFLDLPTTEVWQDSFISWLCRVLSLEGLHIELFIDIAVESGVPNEFIIVFINSQGCFIYCHVSFIRHEGSPDLSLFARVLCKQPSPLLSILNRLQLLNQCLYLFKVILCLLLLSSISHTERFLLCHNMVLLLLLRLL